MLIPGGQPGGGGGWALLELTDALYTKVQTKQNQAIRLIFFARTFGEQTNSALPLLNLLELLTVNNVYRLQALNLLTRGIRTFSQTFSVIFSVR